MTGTTTPGARAPSAPRIVIVGAGFGGLETAKALGKAGMPVTVIDRQNHHLFQPLLYQVATAALSAPDIAEPVRRIVRRYPSVQVLLGDVSKIDPGRRMIELAEGDPVSYDILILATGAGPAYFGRDDWASWAPGLKTIEDARRIRSRLLHSFEKAERTTDPAEQKRLMTFAIIGGGPTGVELAGSIAELSRFTLARDFRHIRPETTRIMLVEAGPKLLGGFAEELSRYAHERLARLGVHVMTDKRVEHIGEDHLVVAGERMPVGLVLWAAGVAASPLARQLDAEIDRAGRVIVDSTMRVRGHDGIYALGDIAHFTDDDGQPLPGLAQVAKQQGAHLGRALAKHLNDGAPLPPFQYRSRGNTAIVGRHAAIFEQGRFKMKGWFAWVAWAIIHVYLLIGFQHRVLVSIQWLWRYLTYERGARLIHSDIDPPAAPEAGSHETADQPGEDQTVTRQPRPASPG